MPIVEMTLLEGYDAQAKQRLVSSLTRAVCSVMAAPPEGVVIVLREVQGGCYARAGVARIPGSPLPAAEAVVRDFIAAARRGDAAAAGALVDKEFAAVRASGEIVSLREHLAQRALQADAQYTRFSDAQGDEGSVLVVEGTRGRARFAETFDVAGGRILRIQQYA